MTSSTAAPADTIRDNEALSRFELDVDGHLAFADYRRQGQLITFTHTEVPPEIGGRGVAGRLVRGALEAVRAQKLKVTTRCDYVAAYLAKHTEFNDLIA